MSTGPSTLDEAIDGTRVGGFLVGTLFLCSLVMIIDGYDFAAMPLALPHVARLWGIPASDFSLALSAVLIGLGLGAVLIAPLGDRHGRRPLVLTSTAVLGLATLGTAFTSSVGGFVAWRLSTGIALGACLPNVTSLVAELVPGRSRAKLMTLVSCGIPIGGMAAGYLAPLLVSIGGWQAIFIASGIVTLLAVAFLSFNLPESPKFLLTHRPDEPSLARLFARLGIRGEPAGFIAGKADAAAPPRSSVLAPLARPYLLATFVFAGIFSVNALSLYMLSSWLPTLLPQAGFTLDEAARMTALTQVGGLIGGLVISWFLDRSMTVVAMLGGYALVIVSLLAFNFLVPQTLSWGLLLLVIGGGISGVHLAIIAVGTAFYPSSILSAALGLAVAIARVGAIAGPLIGGLLIGRNFGPEGFFSVMVVPVLICMGGVLLIPAVKRARALS